MLAVVLNKEHLIPWQQLIDTFERIIVRIDPFESQHSTTVVCAEISTLTLVEEPDFPRNV